MCEWIEEEPQHDTHELVNIMGPPQGEIPFIRTTSIRIVMKLSVETICYTQGIIYLQLLEKFTILCLGLTIAAQLVSALKSSTGENSKMKRANN